MLKSVEQTGDVKLNKKLSRWGKIQEALDTLISSLSAQIQDLFHLIDASNNGLQTGQRWDTFHPIDPQKWTFIDQSVFPDNYHQKELPEQMLRFR